MLLRRIFANTIFQRRESSLTRQSLTMSDNNMSRQSVLDRLNMVMLDDIKIVEEEVKDCTDYSIKKDLVMVKSCTEKRISTTKSIKVHSSFKR